MAVLIFGVSIVALVTSLILFARELMNLRRAKSYAKSAVEASRDLFALSETLKGVLGRGDHSDSTGFTAIGPALSRAGKTFPASVFAHDKSSDLRGEEVLTPKSLVWKYSNWQFDASDRPESSLLALRALSNLQGSVSAEELVGLYRSVGHVPSGTQYLYPSNGGYVSDMYSRGKCIREIAAEKRAPREKRSGKELGRSFTRRSSHV